MARRLIPFVLSGLLAGCGGSPPAPSALPDPPDPPEPPAPAPTEPPPAAPDSVTVSGVVYEHTATGRRPLPGLRITFETNPLPWDAYEPQIETTSGEGGRYEVVHSKGGFLAVTLVGGNFRAPCPAALTSLAGDATLDVHVVSTATLLSTGVPRSLPTTRPKVSGTVIERGPDNSTSPVPGAEVVLAWGLDNFLASRTLTDSTGAFILCTNPPGEGTNQTMHVTAVKVGYTQVSQPVLVTGSDRVSLELVRNDGCQGCWDY